MHHMCNTANKNLSQQVLHTGPGTPITVKCKLELTGTNHLTFYDAAGPLSQYFYSQHTGFMTSTLQKLLAAGLLHCNDELEFSFKGHKFTAKLVKGGFLSHCTWNNTPVLEDKVAFTTLTDWCDTCIQELVDEYVTRFSSWKRVRHTPTGVPLAQIRNKLSAQPSSKTPCRCTQLAREVIELQMQLKEANRLLAGKRKAPEKMSDDNPFRLKF